MPTSSEQKALAFIAIVIVLGGAVRVVRAGSASHATPGEQQAIARQATAADSAASRRKSKGSKRRSKRAARDTTPTVVGGVATVPPSYARPDRPYDHAPYGTPSARNGFPPPGPRIDTDARGARAAAPSLDRKSAKNGRQSEPIDLDTATEEQIESLPRSALLSRSESSRTGTHWAHSARSTA